MHHRSRPNQRSCKRRKQSRRLRPRQASRKCVEPSRCVQRNSQSRKQSRIHPRRNRMHQIVSLFVRLKELTLKSQSAMEAEIPRLNDGFLRPMARWSFGASNPVLASKIPAASTESQISEEGKHRPLKVAVISLGCAKNLVDAEIMLGSVLKCGMTVSS